MRKFLGLFLLAALVLTIGCSKKEETATPAQPAKPATAAAPAAMAMPEFSADMVTKTGSMTMNGKWYASKGKMRMETGPSIMITDMNAKKSWMVMPSSKSYMEMDFSKAAGQMHTGTNPCSTPEMTCKQVGKETIDGRSAIKWEITMTTAGKAMTSTSWIDEKLGIPLKTEAAGTTMELKNVKEGPQPDNLFEVPAGYKKTTMPGMGG